MSFGIGFSKQLTFASEEVSPPAHRASIGLFLATLNGFYYLVLRNSAKASIMAARYMDC